MFWAINKQKGDSSFQAIRKFQRENNIKKIGHCGTLDPLAQGLLIVATNEATKLLPYIINQDKEYICSMRFFASSASYDTDSEVTYLPTRYISLDELNKAINIIKNQTSQIPPIFSAKKINGKRAYELARQNIDFELKASDIKIYTFEILDFNENDFTLTFKTKVSKGTYIRSIVHDLATLLGTDAVMTDLQRTQIGNISLENSQKNFKIDNYSDLFGINIYAINNTQLNQLKSKHFFNDNNLKSNNYILIYNNNLIGIASCNDGLVQPIKILWPIVDNFLAKEK
ncbi:tRNA pseudouridine(55) synthase TruB [[Mycoplasma] gypis]|uniref:tRNA pseudouridine synthase B n=1 Tax=[Mycoplasma] gypis TaxID=92404 RepID=A0ABZ2RVB5_9BACT|nr:tRNA pseudouridine(55) synthase TruB [[Mycoplasma] gypis]MBN0919062.1 tRNA pseudouridine(55) synthase TruB [[Mycoplasma] gypis]